MKKIITGAVSLLLAFSFASCNGGGAEKKPAQKIDIWSTYSTAKVMMDKNLNGNYINLGQKLSVNLAKGEKEMSQVVITAVNSAKYNVKLNDLSCGDVIFSKDNIKVYHQKPINVDVKTTDNYNEKFPTGLTPDCLLPLETAVKYDENVVLANSNQPISFEFEVPSNQKEGKYTGSFEITVDGQSFTVPVCMTVWNYELPKGTFSKSCMLIYQSELFYGEMDSSDEMYTTYFEELLDNKMNAWHVPYTATSPEKMVESVIKYWDYENFNSYGMPDLTFNNEIIYDKQKDYLLELGRKSTEDRILYDKGYFYHTVVDEPHAFPEKKAKVPRIISEVNQLFKDVINQLEAEKFFEGKSEDFKTRMEESISSMPQIVTSPYFSEFDDSNLTYCPTIQFTNPESERQALKSHAEKHNVSTWIYTCNNPVYPYPSTHIDDYLIGSRIMKWMQKAYDMEGYLSWSVNHYSKVIPFSHERKEINPYLDPQRVLGPGQVANGDGYLFYPGKKYKSEKPFTSIRMKSLRDGQDDYDALRVLEEKYNELDKFYNAGNSIDSDKILQNIYDQLFEGVIYNNSDVIFDNARNKVAEMIENTSLDEKFVYTSNIKGKALNVEMYAANGYTVKIDGKEINGIVSGQGNKFVKDISLNDFDGDLNIEVSKGDYKKEYILTAGKVLSATDFSSSTGSEAFELKDNNTVQIVDGEANFTIKSVDRNSDSANLRYRTGFIIKSSAFTTTFDKIDKVYFDVENNSDSDIEFTVYITVGGRKREFMKVALKARQKSTVSLNRLYDFEFSDLSKANGIFISFNNAKDENGKVSLYEDRFISLGDIYYVVK